MEASIRRIWQRLDRHNAGSVQASFSISLLLLLLLLVIIIIVIIIIISSSSSSSSSSSILAAVAQRGPSVQVKDIVANAAFVQQVRSNTY